MTRTAHYPTLRDTINGVAISRLVEEFGGTPLYVYDAETIASRYSELAACGTVRYAQKACSTIAILQYVRKLGAKIDSVSAAELRRALLAGYRPDEIAYTADIFDADALDLVVGDADGCGVNVGSPDMIRQFGERLGARARGRELTLRVNPGFGHGHSWKTNTGGPFSKHGVWHTQIGDCLELAKSYGMTITGLHMHIGSGSDFEHLSTVCQAMSNAAKSVGAQIRMISCGGGLPVPYEDGEKYIDLERFAQLWRGTVDELAKLFGHEIEFELEPGRYLVAESGYLISQIRAVKKQDENVFYLVDAGFTHLIRPMAYGSYHPISIAYATPERAAQNPGTQEVVVAGPLCESGDVFTQNGDGRVITRELPVAQVGDYLILEVAGAYGASMASNYNSKFYAPEVLIEQGVPRLIRKRQTFEHLIANEIF